MKLLELLTGREYSVVQGRMDTKIQKPVYDSRKVEKGDLFVCITGFQTDGHKYVKNAVDAGAVAILCEKQIQIEDDIVVIQTKNTREALALL